MHGLSFWSSKTIFNFRRQYFNLTDNRWNLRKVLDLDIFLSYAKKVWGLLDWTCRKDIIYCKLCSDLMKNLALDYTTSKPCQGIGCFDLLFNPILLELFPSLRIGRYYSSSTHRASIYFRSPDEDSF